MLEKSKGYTFNFFSVENLKAYGLIFVSFFFLIPYFGILHQVIQNSNADQSFLKDLYADGIGDVLKKGLLFFLFSFVLVIISSLVFALFSFPAGFVIFYFGFEALNFGTGLGIALIMSIIFFVLVGLFFFWLYFGASIITYCRDDLGFFKSLISRNNWEYLNNSSFYAGIFMYVFVSQIIAALILLIPGINLVFAVAYPVYFVYSVGFIPLYLSSNKDNDEDDIEKDIRNKWNSGRKNREEIFDLID